jgi:hypothetical protein
MEITRDALKKIFVAKAKPTAEQFANLFDSFFHKSDSLPSNPDIAATIAKLQTELASLAGQLGTIQGKFPELVNKSYLEDQFGKKLSDLYDLYREVHSENQTYASDIQTIQMNLQQVINDVADINNRLVNMGV